MSADFEGNDKDAVVTQQVLDVIDSYGFKKEGAYNLRPVSYTHLTLPTICSV